MASTMRSKVWTSLLLTACHMLGGCVHPHLYPVCFYQASPPQQRLQEYYGPQLVTLVQNAVGDSKQAKASLSPDGRWLTANVTRRQDRNLGAVWPRVGCLGNALDSQETKQEADCVAYLDLFVKTHNYLLFGNAKDKGGFDIWNESPARNTLVHCHQVKEDEASQQ
jgi:hypothetical protein